jgi:hypothetical protein
MNDPLARTTELAFVDMTALATVDAVYVPPDIVSVAVLAFKTPSAVDAVTFPEIETTPVEIFRIPLAVELLPPVTFPVIEMVPASAFCTP